MGGEGDEVRWVVRVMLSDGGEVGSEGDVG